MDHADEAAQPPRPRQQLSCVQCRRRKVKCDHERPCKRCRIRGWDTQCSYPLHVPPAPAAPSPGRASRGRDCRTASPSIAPRPPVPTSALPLASAYHSPSEPADLATPESLSASHDTTYRSLHRPPSHPAAPLATPLPASPYTLPRPPSTSEQNASASLQPAAPTVSASNPALEPRAGEDHALYLANGETVYFGRSSAPWLISKFGTIMSYMHSDRASWQKSERVSVIRIKRLTSQQLLLANDQDELPPDALYSEVPTREIADFCVSNYFQSIERMYPLFDGPKFRAEYESFWEAPTQASLVFVVILILVICAGNGTIPNDERPIPRSRIIRWWRLGLTWQGAAAETNERMISTIQGSFLVVLLRQIYSLSETAEWVSSGALVKNALAMGLHRDPSKLYGIPPDEHELRRRLFYTVLELDLQYCLNAGMKPTLRIGDWDTALPTVPRETRNCCSDSGAISIQDRMLSSFYTRMKIACSVNAIIPEDDYDKVLSLSNQLSKSFHGLEKEPRNCQTEALRFLQNRYLLTLHIPFAIAGDPKYAYSQNVSLASALSILEQITPAPATPEQRQQHGAASAGNSPDGSRRNSPISNDNNNNNNNRTDNICTTALHASGMLFKNAGLYAALYLCHELIRDEHDGTLPPGPSHFPGSTSTTPCPPPPPPPPPSVPSPPSPSSSTSLCYYPPITPNLVRTLPSVEGRVVALIERFVKVAEERLRTTQFAGKAFIIPRMVLAYHRISADPEVRTLEEKERRLLEAGKVIAEICFSIFCSNPDVAKVL
ncbi:c6 zinc finger domain-containing protein [Diplodia corticola]|uniref:C6 zinc finger domain-containing protein n=1 Tax=Diplodia corticola TaxID=236234 RepID=A0A1J9RY94_9PEZI|nr:c6 zinc finger domain-containing protein [Diplodia corticola]OJD33319.1 c6 zinc finger domain-containing protein [Diplodia corticola]